MDAIGGGVLVAAAAVLWITYLLPSWLRRRQYLATERNAVRLQQTLRILAETAETPEPVRVEATAREVATQQRILHEHEHTARLAAQAAEHLATAERRAAEQAADAARDVAASVRAPITEPMHTAAGVGSTGSTSTSAASRARARRTLRRRRALCSLLLLISLLTAVAGLVAGAFGASLFIAGGGGIGVVVAFGGLVGLARVRTAAVAVDTQAVAPDAWPFEPIEVAEPAADEHGWTPQPLPRPLHLSRGTIAAMAMASIEAAAELKRAAAEADVVRRANELEPPVPTIARPAARVSAGNESLANSRAATPASPYARMGIVDDTVPGFDDLDAVLRRRRQAG